MRRLIKYGTGLVAILGLLLLFSPANVKAEVKTIFVEDYAGILNDQDKMAIRDLNEKTFKELEGEPQYAVVTLKNLDKYGSIEDYAEKKFQKLGIGNENSDNGFLFVISIEDHDYRLETGYGVEAVITDGMKRDIVTSDIEDELRAENYGKAVMMITANIEKVVVERYGDYAASVAQVDESKARTRQFIKMVLMGIMSLGLVFVFGIFQHNQKKKKIQKAAEKFVSPELQVQLYNNPRKPLVLGGQQLPTDHRLRDWQLSKAVATALISQPAWKNVDDREELLKEQIGKFFVEDAVVKYWKQKPENAEYNLDIYLEHDSFNSLVATYHQQFFNQTVLTRNPLTGEVGYKIIKEFVDKVTQEHKRALQITAQNKAKVKSVSEQFLVNNNVRFRDTTDQRLMVALMVYFVLKDRNLADPNLVTQNLIGQPEIERAYGFARKKRQSIERSYRNKAIADLESMMLGTYFLQSSMMWSSYRSSSSGSSLGGGSSFGGGSSGGGGFSGKW